MVSLTKFDTFRICIVNIRHVYSVVPHNTIPAVFLEVGVLFTYKLTPNSAGLVLCTAECPNRPKYYRSRRHTSSDDWKVLRIGDTPVLINKDDTRFMWVDIICHLMRQFHKWILHNLWSRIRFTNSAMWTSANYVVVYSSCNHLLILKVRGPVDRFAYKWREARRRGFVQVWNCRSNSIPQNLHWARRQATKRGWENQLKPQCGYIRYVH